MAAADVCTREKRRRRREIQYEIIFHRSSSAGQLTRTTTWADLPEKAEAKGAAGAGASAAAEMAAAAAAAADVAEGKSAVLKSKAPSLQCSRWAQSALSSTLYPRCVEKYPNGCVSQTCLRFSRNGRVFRRDSQFCSEFTGRFTQARWR